MSDYIWPDDADQAVIDAVAYNAYPNTAKVVTARKGHPCSMAPDVSWGRGCHPIHSGEKYVRVTVFWPGRRAPITAGVCSACVDGCSTLPRIPEEAPDA